MGKMELVRKQRGLPFIKRGMRVKHTHNGKFGVIAGSNESGNINVRFDGERKSVNCHPLWKMQYFNTNGELIAEYRGEDALVDAYQEALDSCCYLRQAIYERQTVGVENES